VVHEGTSKRQVPATAASIAVAGFSRRAGDVSVTLLAVVVARTALASGSLGAAGGVRANFGATTRVDFRAARRHRWLVAWRILAAASTHAGFSQLT
jgi:hypothetical protein